VQAGPFGARHREVRSLFSSARNELGAADRANTPRIPSARGREAGDPQGQEADERRTPAELVAVLAMERGRVARGLVRRCIALASAR